MLQVWSGGLRSLASQLRDSSCLGRSVLPSVCETGGPEFGWEWRGVVVWLSFHPSDSCFRSCSRAPKVSGRSSGTCIRSKTTLGRTVGGKDAEISTRTLRALSREDAELRLRSQPRCPHHPRNPPREMREALARRALPWRNPGRRSRASRRRHPECSGAAFRWRRSWCSRERPSCQEGKTLTASQWAFSRDLRFGSWAKSRRRSCAICSGDLVQTATSPRSHPQGVWVTWRLTRRHCPRSVWADVLTGEVNRWWTSFHSIFAYRFSLRWPQRKEKEQQTVGAEWCPRTRRPAPPRQAQRTSSEQEAQEGDDLHVRILHSLKDGQHARNHHSGDPHRKDSSTTTRARNLISASSFSSCAACRAVGRSRCRRNPRCWTLRRRWSRGKLSCAILPSLAQDWCCDWRRSGIPTSRSWRCATLPSEAAEAASVDLSWNLPGSRWSVPHATETKNTTISGFSLLFFFDSRPQRPAPRVCFRNPASVELVIAARATASRRHCSLAFWVASHFPTADPCPDRVERLDDDQMAYGAAPFLYVSRPSAF